MSKVSWYDMQNMTSKELKKKYKTNDLGLERRVRTHLDGATAAERRDVYETVWSNKGKQ